MTLPDFLPRSLLSICCVLTFLRSTCVVHTTDTQVVRPQCICLQPDTSHLHNPLIVSTHYSFISTPTEVTTHTTLQNPARDINIYEPNMSAAKPTPITSEAAKDIETHCLKLRKAAIAAISTLSRTSFPTPQEEANISQRHHNVTTCFIKLLHSEAYPTRGAAFAELVVLYSDLQFFIDQFSPENAGLMASCLAVLLSDLYMNTLIPRLECMIDYLRIATLPKKKELGTFELLGDAISWYYAKRCTTKPQAGEKDRVTMRKARMKAQSMADRLKTEEKAKTQEGLELRGGNTEERAVASRVDGVVEVGTTEMARPSMAETVFKALRCASPVVEEVAGREMG